MIVIVILSRIQGKFCQDGQIPPLAEIFCDIPLFWNYLGIYHSFGNRAQETQVLHETRVYEN